MKPTFSQAARMRGARVTLTTRGRWVVADVPGKDGNAQRLQVTVEDLPPMADPSEMAQAKTPVYTRLSALAGSVSNPRVVGRFTEEDGRFHKVLEFEESSGDKVWWRWRCEAQRQSAGAGAVVLPLPGPSLPSSMLAALAPPGLVLTEMPQICVWSGDPNGHVLAKSPAICLDPQQKIWWWKTDGVTSNTGWY